MMDLCQSVKPFPSIFNCVDPALYSENESGSRFICGSGFTTLLRNMKTGKIIVTIIVTNNAGTTLTEGFELLILFLKQLLVSYETVHFYNKTATRDYKPASF